MTDKIKTKAEATGSVTAAEADASADTSDKPNSSFKRIWGVPVAGHGYTAIPNIMLRGQASLKLNRTQFNILAQLLSYWFDPERPPFPSKKELAERLRVTPKTIQMNMRALQKAGFIQREQIVTAYGDFGSNRYHMDGLISHVQKLEPEFTKARKKRQEAKEEVERPRRRAAPTKHK